MIREFISWVRRFFDDTEERERQARLDKQLWAMQFINDLKRKGKPD